MDCAICGHALQTIFHGRCFTIKVGHAIHDILGVLSVLGRLPFFSFIFSCFMTAFLEEDTLELDTVATGVGNA